MPDISTTLKTMDLGGLLADALREATLHTPVAWEPESPEELVGLFPRYEIRRLIGRGGMGAVYEARQLDLGRQVALKILPPELGANGAFAERFRREARALGRLAHANILEVYEFGESAAGHLFFSMQYVEGGDLGALLKKGPLPQSDALRIIKEICAALEAAHAEGIIHRDIKPSNILLTPDGTVKVADFGIAVLEDQPKERLTYTGVAVGTMEYAAPEQAAGTTVDTRSDLYSLGVICYEVLTGQLPRGIFDPPSKLNTSVPPAMDSVVRTAMQNDPARRFQTATAFGAALHRTGEKHPRFQHWMLPAAAMVLLASAAAVVSWWPGNVPAPAALVFSSDNHVVFWGARNGVEGNIPAGLTHVKSIRAGFNHIVALRADGSVVAWGKNTQGQTTLPVGLRDCLAVAAGARHSMALKSDGTVSAWGEPDHRQTQVPEGLRDVKAIAAGWLHSLALKQDGSVLAWGSNAYGQCDVPPGLPKVSAISAGNAHTLVLLEDGTVRIWGDNTHGQCTVPAGLVKVKAIAAGGFHNVALMADGTVVVWGNNDAGQTILPEGIAGAVEIAAGYRHTLALKRDGTLIAWGWGDDGQCQVPVGLSGVQAFAAGEFCSVAVVSGPPAVFPPQAR